MEVTRSGATAELTCVSAVRTLRWILARKCGGDTGGSHSEVSRSCRRRKPRTPQGLFRLGFKIKVRVPFSCRFNCNRADFG